MGRWLSTGFPQLYVWAVCIVLWTIWRTKRTQENIICNLGKYLSLTTLYLSWQMMIAYISILNVENSSLLKWESSCSWGKVGAGSHRLSSFVSIWFSQKRVGAGEERVSSSPCSPSSVWVCASSATWSLLIVAQWPLTKMFSKAANWRNFDKPV